VVVDAHPRARAHKLLHLADSRRHL
jgi:hypothetical protein